jgi:hypothetical protein
VLRVLARPDTEPTAKRCATRLPALQSTAGLASLSAVGGVLSFGHCPALQSTAAHDALVARFAKP